MKLLLDIKDDKADFIMELLKNFKFVKSETLTPEKAETLKGIRDAVFEMNAIKSGKKEAQSLNDFLNDL